MEVANGVVSKIEGLERENASKKDEIQKLRKEIDSLRRDRKAETSAAEEARSAAALRKVLEERECRVRFLEREAKSLKRKNAESEMKVRNLERRLGVLEVRESEERSKRVRAEEETKEKVGEREREIEVLRQRIEDLEKARVAEKGGVGFREEGERVEGKGKKEFGLVWPVVAAGCGAVAAVFYLCFPKRR